MITDKELIDAIRVYLEKDIKEYIRTGDKETADSASYILMVAEEEYAKGTLTTSADGLLIIKAINTIVKMELGLNGNN